jgi:hypothetical protein
MTIFPSNVPLGTSFNAGPAPSAAETKQIVIKEIRAKWGKFSEDDLSSLKNKDDLVTQRAAKYGLEKSLAKRHIDALMNGRQCGPRSEARFQVACAKGPAE